MDATTVRRRTIEPHVAADAQELDATSAAAFDRMLERVRLKAIAALHPGAAAAEELPMIEARLAAEPWPARSVLQRIGLGCGSIATGLVGSNLDHLTNLSLGRSRGSGLGTVRSA